MTTSKLPARPSLESLLTQAKKLARGIAAGDPGTIGRARAHLPKAKLSLSQRDAKLVLAREYGFPGWKDLVSEVKQRLEESSGPYPRRAASSMTMTSKVCGGYWRNTRRFCRGRRMRTTAGCSGWPQVRSATAATRSGRSTSRARHVPNSCSMPAQSSCRRYATT